MQTLGMVAIFHDAAVVLCEGGEVVYGIEEERLSRLKYELVFPQKALSHVLDARRVVLGDVDALGFFLKPRFDAGWVWQLAKDDLLKRPGDTLSLVGSKHAGEIFVREATRFNLTNFAKTRRTKSPRVVYEPNHLCHAAHAYATSFFDDAAILVFDEVGDAAATSLYKATPSGIERIGGVDFPHSIGEVYSAVTQHLGFRFCADEWKLAALSAGVDPDPELDAFFAELIRLLPDGGYAVDLRFTNFHKNPFGFEEFLSKRAAERIGPARKPDEPITDRHRAVARAMQARAEEALFHVLRDLHHRTGATNLCYAGGIAYNTVANGKILANTPFTRVHVPFGPGKEGCAIGAALLAQGTPVRPDGCPTPFIGPSYGDDEIERELLRTGLPYRRLTNVARETAELLAAGGIVAWFQGRLEYGARGLGHRGILADARPAGVKARLDAAVRSKEDYRPHCVAVLANRVGEYFEDAGPSPYGSFSWRARGSTPRGLADVDGTMLVQTVTEHAVPELHAVLVEFERATGLGLIVNAPFNLIDEPLVCNPLDAVRGLFATGADHLVIGSFLMSKR